MKKNKKDISNQEKISFMNRLSVKAILTVVVILILAFSVLTYFISNKVEEETTKLALDRNLKTVEYIDSEVENQLRGTRKVIETLATNKNIVEGDYEEKKMIFSRVAEYNDQFNYLYFSTPQGDHYPFPEVSLSSEYDPRERSWYQDAQANSEVIWTDIYLDAATKELVITIATPVFINGQFEGVLGGDVNLNFLSNLVNDVQVGQQGQAYIVDQNGQYIAHPEIEKVFEKENIDQNFSLSSLTNNSDQSFTYQLEDEKRLVSYRKLDEIPGYIMAEVPESEINEASNTIISRIIFASVIILVLLSVIIFIAFRKYIVSPIKSILDFANDIANGNLKSELEVSKNKDEFNLLMKALNKMRDSLINIISDISKQADQVAASSQELSAAGEQVGNSAENVGRSIQNVASGAEEQSAQIDETEKVFENLEEYLIEISERASLMRQDTEKVMSNIQSGTKQVNMSVDGINEVKQDTEEASATINKLGELSQEIGEIVELIRGIADQTNLLALNAAIEAARAGESGRGFSVVADEIRQLAEESQSATDNISNLIAKVQDNVENAVNKMNQNRTKVDKSVNNIENTGKVFKDIKNDSEAVVEGINEINGKTNKVEDGSSTVKNYLKEVNSVSEEAASNAEEVAASSEEQVAATEEIISSAKNMAQIAESLAKSINKFEF